MCVILIVLVVVGWFDIVFSTLHYASLIFGRCWSVGGKFEGKNIEFFGGTANHCMGFI